MTNLSISEAASILGRLGGRAKSPRKAAASRRNGKLGGRRKITAAQINKFADRIVGEWRGIFAWGGLFQKKNPRPPKGFFRLTFSPNTPAPAFIFLPSPPLIPPPP